MLALGSPLHFFDISLLSEGRIVVRRAAAGEKIVTLDGHERALDPRDLVIADAEPAGRDRRDHGRRGQRSHRDETTDLLLEAANFEPLTVLRDLATPPAAQRGLDALREGRRPATRPEQAAVYASELIVALAGRGSPGRPTSMRRSPSARRAVATGARRTPPRHDVPEAEQRETLGRLGFELDGRPGVTVPTWRARDVTRESTSSRRSAGSGSSEVPADAACTRRRVEVQFSTKSSACDGWSKTSSPARGFERRTRGACGRRSRPGAIRLEDPYPGQAVLRTTCFRPPRVSGAEPSTPGSRRSRCSSSLVSTCRPASRCPKSAGTSPPSPRAASSVRRGLSRARATALGVQLQLSSAARAGRCSIPEGGANASRRVGELPRRPDGVGLLRIRSRALLAAAPEAVVYTDVITFPAVKQDLAFASTRRSQLPT